MPELLHASHVDAPPAEVFAWHARPGALERLLPPWRDVRVVERSGQLRDGATTVLELRLGPLRWRWVAWHRDVQEGRQFSDEQVRGPFRRWRHLHRFLAAGQDQCLLEDRVEYELPLGSLGELAAGAYVRRELVRTFRWRHRRIRQDLALHRAAGGAVFRVAITGASGLVGSALSAFLRSGGHRVDPLVRGEPRPGTTGVRWSPSRGEIDGAALEGVDAVVHLAGENIFALRWTAEKKRRIRDSRVRGTELLARALAGLPSPPRVLVSASAVGYYGDRGEAWLRESDPAGEGFLAGVCREWEAALRPAEDAGIRVVRLRTGIVLTPRGGALRTMLPAFRLGLGAVLGSGRQYVSWIDLDDLLAVIHRALLDDRLEGAVNAVAPVPVTNRELTATLARVLRRPAFLRAPASLLRALGGEMARETLLAGGRVRPARLLEAGHSFLFPELEGAMRWELGRLA